VLVLAGSAGAANLVVNGSFESNLVAWTQYDPSGTYTYPTFWGDVNGIGSDASGNPYSGVGHRWEQNYSAFFPHDGNAEYVFGAYDPLTQGTDLYQDIATTPGQQYQVSFWIQHSHVTNPGSDVWFKADFGGVEMLDLVGGVNFFEGVGPGGGNVTGLDANILGSDNWRYMTNYTYTVTATDANTRLLFAGYNNNDDYWHLDDISVVAAPEPVTAALLALGGLALLRRKRK
jgi:hypothetical protein